MSLQQLLLMALVIPADLSSSYATTPDCPSLQPVIHVTISPTLDDVQLVTSNLHRTWTVFATEGVNVTTHQGQEVFVTETAATTVYITSTVLHRVTVNVSQVFTRVVPFRVTTTVMRIVTNTETTHTDVSFIRTVTHHWVAYEETYESTPVVVTAVEMVPTCTSKVTVTARPTGDLISTVDVLGNITTTLFKLYSTSTSTTTLIVTRTPGVGQRCV